MFLQIKHMNHMQIISVVFSMKLHFRLSDDYNPICHHKIQGNIYIKVIIYICHKKRGHLPLIDQKKSCQNYSAVLFSLCRNVEN